MTGGKDANEASIKVALTTNGHPSPWVAKASIILCLLAAAFVLGSQASMTWLVLIVAGAGVLALLRFPTAGLYALILLALVLPRSIGTGSEVELNLATLLLPLLAALGVLRLVRASPRAIEPAQPILPLILFLVANLIALVVGIATWDPNVPRKAGFILVQLSQWGVFALSALALLLGAYVPRSEKALGRLACFFLAAAVPVALLRALPIAPAFLTNLATFASLRAPFWALLAGVSGSVLLFGGRGIGLGWRAVAGVGVGVSLYYAFAIDREAISTWAGVAATLALLLWLRLPRVRWLIVTVVAILILLNLLVPAVYNFSGGDQEWTLSGESRLVLIRRVIDVTMRNPITGLGPAAYRPYTQVQPLAYGRAYWLQPSINSHNNYVDLFAHGGLLGVALFLWFVAEMARLGLRMRRRHCTSGWGSVFANLALAVGFASLVLMMLADWILPFVYNIGFLGFQASVLVWLFVGSLIALDNPHFTPSTADADTDGRPASE